ncbi:hypothetical protein [Arthrobacter zhaoguopingii]|uniref:hypothetical protein n=1 Tax=Arthrobacter zhaoguopingii TaxID=2681491 RepID=UPI001356E0F2|nr:hypothetical protein [Arthrobacter zhaoguopingii]
MNDGVNWITQPVEPNSAVTRSGTVLNFLAGASRAIVEFDNGERATIRNESLLPDVPLDWLFAKGHRVTGRYDPATGELRCMLLVGSLSVPSHYPPECTTLALVESISLTDGHLSLFPGATFPLGLSDITSNELDTLDDLLTVGEVVAVRVSYAAGAVRLSMLDVDDTDPMTKPPVLVEGGTPWLEYGRNLPLHESRPRDLEVQLSEDWSPAQGTAFKAPGTDPESPSAGIGDRAANRKALQDTLRALDSARSEIAQLKHRLHTAEIIKTPLSNQSVRVAKERLSSTELESKLHAAERKIEAQQQSLIAASERLADLRKKLRGARTESGATHHAPVFADEEEQVRHEIYLTWASRISPADKGAHPLREYALGPHFTRSMKSLSEDKKRKALRAVVDLVAGSVDALAAHSPHVLRDNPAGGAPAVTRNNGSEVCWRLAIEQNSEAARRLHYWKRADGLVELSRVVVHDDYKP